MFSFSLSSEEAAAQEVSEPSIPSVAVLLPIKNLAVAAPPAVPELYQIQKLCDTKH